jgi:hypothetical protein
MTNKASPGRPKGEPDLARFLQDWTALWRDELQVQTNDPEAATGAMEMWRAAIAAWTGGFGMPPLRPAAPRDSTGAPRTQAVAAAPDARDAEVERLARRVNELEARIVKLEAAARRRG